LQTRLKTIVQYLLEGTALVIRIDTTDAHYIIYLRLYASAETEYFMRTVVLINYRLDSVPSNKYCTIVFRRVCNHLLIYVCTILKLQNFHIHYARIWY
jgi:hypothetical protein